MVKITKLPPDRWRDFRSLRLESLRKDPSAFGSSFEEEEKFTEGKWRVRIQNVLFALSDSRPIGMVTYVFDEGLKTKHIAEIYGFYVSAGHRGEGVGTKLLEQALSLIRKKKGIVKVRLYVNTKQGAAVSLYKKAGFVVTGKMEKELKVGLRFFDMLMMEKVF
ncbi:MAG TPA: GNAT family N-acetyltransferase [Nitrososphaerales archaeon]|nr:GNAT family N-acetyltransferase [Nitrososphaerales archaeon]